MRAVQLAVSHQQRLLWIFAGAAIVLGAVGQLLLRYVGRSLGDAAIGELDQVEWQRLSAVWNLFGHELTVLLLACLCYTMAVLTWLRVLQRLPLSQAYPLLGLGYVLVYAGAVAWLGEAPRWNRTLGTALVAVGVALAVMPRPPAGG